MPEPNGERGEGLTPEEIETQSTQLVEEIEGLVKEEQDPTAKPDEIVATLLGGPEFQQKPKAVQDRVREILKGKGLIPAEKPPPREPPKKWPFKGYEFGTSREGRPVIFEIKTDDKGEEREFITGLPIPPDFKDIQGTPKENEYLDLLKEAREEADKQRVRVDVNRNDPDNIEVTIPYRVGGEMRGKVFKHDEIPAHVRALIRDNPNFGNLSEFKRWRNHLVARTREIVMQHFVEKKWPAFAQAPKPKEPLKPKEPAPTVPAKPPEALKPEDVGLTPERAGRLRELVRSQLVKQYNATLKAKYPSMKPELVAGNAEHFADEDLEEAFQDALRKLRDRNKSS